MATVFISYCHRDKHWLERLQIHLRPLERQGSFDVGFWAARRYRTQAADGETRFAMRSTSAEVAVLLVSADFLACRFHQRERSWCPFSKPRRTAASPFFRSSSVRPGPSTLRPCLSINRSTMPPRKPLVNLTHGEQEEVFVKLSEELGTALSRPIALLKHELQEKFQQSDAKIQPTLRQFAADPSLSEEDPRSYSLSLLLVCSSDKLLTVVKAINTLDPADPLSRRKRQFLEQEEERPVSNFGRSTSQLAKKT